MRPLDPRFNSAIMHITSKLFPKGFDVSHDAPDTYEKLKAHLDAGNRMVVWNGGSEHTIYADAQVNFAFRAWHDWHHWRGRHPFTPEGEKAVCDLQCRDLREHFGYYSLEVDRWCKILNAEIMGQQNYFDQHGYFPDDQRAFVEEFLRPNKV